MTVYVDPSSPIGLMLRAGAMGTLLLLVGGGTVLLLVLLLSLLAGWRRAARAAGMALAAVVALWVTSLGLSLALLRGRTLARGDELAFCGFDCHLHVGVREVRRGERLDVVLALRSDARREPEYPSLLDIAIVAGDGRRFEAVSGDVGGALAAGESREATLSFDVPPDAGELRLVANWNGLPDWLVPGPEQVVVQRRSGIALVDGASR